VSTDIVFGYILAPVSPRPNNTFFDSEPGGREAAPGSVALVQAFVNTVAEEGGQRWEAFADPDYLRSWLVRNGLLDDGEAVGDADVIWARDVRRALRSLLAANNGGEVYPEAVKTLNRAAKRAVLVVRFGPGGRTAAPESVAGGVDGAIGRVLSAAHAGMEEGTWERLKTCANGRCGWAFYDRSKNRSGRWCSMGVCGNRTKTRAYRRRRTAREV